MRITFKATKTITPRELWSLTLTFRNLYTKLNLISQGRIEDLIEYDKGENNQFENEFPLIVEKAHANEQSMPEGSEINIVAEDPIDSKVVEALQMIGEMLGWQKS